MAEDVDCLNAAPAAASSVSDWNAAYSCSATVNPWLSPRASRRRRFAAEIKTIDRLAAEAS